MKGQIIRLNWILPSLLCNGCRPHCLHKCLLIKACKISAGTQESVAPLLVACATAPLKMPFMMHVKELAADRPSQLHGPRVTRMNLCNSYA